MPSNLDTVSNKGAMNCSDNSRAVSDDHADHREEFQNTRLVFPTEIPDSQPGSPNSDLNNDEPPSERANLQSVHTVIIPGATKLTPKPEPRWPLHKQGINCNGRLPSEALKDEDDMEEEELTQQATQPFIDPRRRGITSMLSDRDESDIICILFPTSPPAYEAVKLTAKAAPQHILQNHAISQIDEESEDIPLEDNKTRSDRSPDSDIENTQRHDARKGEDGSDRIESARDIALRFSSQVHNICLGFTFGRNPRTCDVLLSGDNNKQVSNKHFRIYFNSNGSLMLEDTSTNGTIVDGTLLQGSKAKMMKGDPQPRHTILGGGMIDLPTITRENGDSVRFGVRMPSRDNHLEKYRQNLVAYLNLVEQAERQATATANAASNGLPIAPPPIPMNALQHGLRLETTPNGSILAAATGQNNHHGLHWNGGDKYNVVSYIGKGAFAMVYKLSSKRDGEVYAVKEIDKVKLMKGGSSTQKAQKEVDVIKNLRHPNIVKYVGHHNTPTHLFIIMEFVPLGDLCAWTSAGSAMPEYICTHLARQIMQALDYLHQRGIVHRDIKPDNILMASDYPSVFKLSDFGLSKMVTNAEEYLKTFCGTLLYCAPEIYPGYQRVKTGLPLSTKRTRAKDGPNHKTLPYEHSVDTWSFAAVLYHLLCGRAPFAGAHEAQMLMNVMSLPVDWDRLKQAGISDGGVDFVQKMLVTDPSQRARDDVLLEHPWLISASQIPDLEQGEAEELDASQLSLADSGENEGDGLDYYDDMEDAREHKRIRPWLQEGGQRDVWGEIVSRHQIGITGLAPSMSQPPPPQRLFGEIGTSALRSLGVLGQTAQVALQAPGAGSYDPLAFRAASGGSYDPSAFRAAGGGSHDLTVLGAPGGGSYDPAVFGAPGDGSYNSSSASASYMNPEATSAEDVSYIDPGHVSAHPTNEGVTPQNIQYPQLVPGSAYNIGAPSLLGTEALVGQLNMASPESGVSGPSVDSKRASPKTPHSRELSPTLPGSKRPSQDIRPSEDEISLKRSKTNRTPSSPSTRRQSDEASARYATYGSQTGGEGDDHASRARKEAAQPVKCNDTWQSTDCDDHHDGQQARERTKSNMSMPPTAFNSQDWAHDPNDGDKAISKPASRRQSASSNTAGKATSRHQSPANKSIPPSITYTRPTSAGKGPVIAVSDDADFVKPPMIFGNLIAIKGSVPTVHKIKITSRITTFGRALDSSFIHQNSREDRVPKNAIDIQMWYPNIEKDIAAGRDPYNKKELTAIISTRTSRYIKVNGIRLMRGKGCWLYGELRTGDIVSIFELPEESKVMKPEDNEFLRFRCEFYVGASREARKEGHPFKVEKEEEKYNQNVARKSCESTEAVDLIADNNDKGNGQGSNTATKAT